MSANLDNAAVDNTDAHVDEEIKACLNLRSPQSFFLFAGAGSGKTRSLIEALIHIQENLAEQLRNRGQHVGVITYTNAASDEIKRRIRFDPLIDVRTIHSFAWSLIEGLNSDIREWLKINLTTEIADLTTDEAKGRKGTKASATRLSKIESKSKRLQNIPDIRRFIYSPTGENRGRDSLNHSEVLQLTAHFLKTKPAMQSILAGRYPILFIDESQDTNKNLIDALFSVQTSLKNNFILGLLGDMMQRIYSDGKEKLEQSFPKDWKTPRKKLNHRCPKRIVSLINKIRSSADGEAQIPRKDAAEGLVRLFVLPNSHKDKPDAERAIAAYMANACGDNEWNKPTSIKTLTLEHRMAAKRLAFLEIFVPLYEIESWRTGFLDGTLPVSSFFTKQVLPLVEAKRREDRFAVARIAKEFSPLLSQTALISAKDKQKLLQTTALALDTLMNLWSKDKDPTLLQILQCTAQTNLLEIPTVLQPYISDTFARTVEDSHEEDEEQDKQTEKGVAIEQFLNAPFSQIKPLANYLTGNAHFDTHQGVKGLEFERVMVIMDDSEARGFLFKYDDLFGGKTGADKSIEATKRLFYVTCSRATKSLALVAYTADLQRVRKFVLDEHWFENEEVIIEVPT